jgi:hypothetical protein
MTVIKLDPLNMVFCYNQLFHRLLLLIGLSWNQNGEKVGMCSDDDGYVPE